MLYYKNIKHNNFGRPIYSSYRLCGPIPKMYATQSSFTNSTNIKEHNAISLLQFVV